MADSESPKMQSESDTHLAKKVFIAVKAVILVLLVASAAIHGHPVEECVTALIGSSA